MNILNKKKIYSSLDKQFELLEQAVIPSFKERIKDEGVKELRPTSLDILQVNMGKMCNQTCTHCHVDAGPHRKEIMGKEVMELCLKAIDKGGVRVVDLTGGAPELNPNFRWFVEELSERNIYIIVRCNLTIILSNPKYTSLPAFYRKHNVEVISSLPCYSEKGTNDQRGDGVFNQSIKALKMLNDVGYGINKDGLQLHLVFNPSGANLPPAQLLLEKEFKENLSTEYGIRFNRLFAITNMPINRFLDYLIETNAYDMYMKQLFKTFNPTAIKALMCRSTLSIGWDGTLYDCDFNQMLEMKCKNIKHIRDFDKEILSNRTIKTGKHCYGCTAGLGSSCGGELV